MIDLLLSRIQFFILLIFLMLFYFLMFNFIFTRRPVSKMIVLAYAYNMIIFFIAYNVFIFRKESVIFEFLTMSIFGFILNALNGIFIINNIITQRDDE
ncbi:MAG: hypothetical protein LBB09_02820 [Rickettsiales bacterium]|jgi:hypothetical protein|nr:hypothetical protein [Rickettsiales bacterium]